MLEKILIPLFIALGGLFAIFCAFKDYDWFMEHRKARAISAIIGRTGTRVFYATLGLALFVVGVALLLRPALEAAG